MQTEAGRADAFLSADSAKIGSYQRLVDRGARDENEDLKLAFGCPSEAVSHPAWDRDQGGRSGAGTAGRTNDQEAKTDPQKYQSVSLPVYQKQATESW
ncbi:hypothetical protein RJ035_001123, partial [Blastomyces gilchristii]